MVEGRAKQVQEIVDMLFSFQELGFQEFETQKYLTGILEKEGFTVQRGVAGIPSAWIARWGNGEAGNCAWLRRRRNSTGRTEAGRRLQRPDDRRCSLAMAKVITRDRR